MLIGDAARSGRPVLHVARDDARMATLGRGAGLLPSRDLTVAGPAGLGLPALRPRLAQRRRRRAAHRHPGGAGPAGRPGRMVLITTVNAALQRVPQRALVRGHRLRRQGRRQARPQGADRVPGAQRLYPLRHGARGRRVRGARRHRRPVPAGHPTSRCGSTCSATRSRASAPSIRCRSARRGKVDRLLLRPVSEVFLDDASVAALPHRLSRAVRRGRRRRSALRGDQRRPALSGLGALAAAVPRPARDRVRLCAGCRGHARPPGRRGGRRAAGADRGVLRDARAGWSRGRQAEGAPYRPLPPDQPLPDRRRVGRGAQRAARSARSRPSPSRRAPRSSMPAASPGRTSPPVRNKPGASLFDAVRAQIAEEQRRRPPRGRDRLQRRVARAPRRAAARAWHRARRRGRGLGRRRARRPRTTSRWSCSASSTASSPPTRRSSPSRTSSATAWCAPAAAQPLRQLPHRGLDPRRRRPRRPCRSRHRPLRRAGDARGRRRARTIACA